MTSVFPPADGRLPAEGDRATTGAMQIGIDSFVSTVTDLSTGVVVSPADRMGHLLEEIELADQVGLDSFGVGEHHRREFYDSAPAVILAAAAADAPVTESAVADVAVVEVLTGG